MAVGMAWHGMGAPGMGWALLAWRAWQLSGSPLRVFAAKTSRASTSHSLCLTKPIRARAPAGGLGGLHPWLALLDVARARVELNFMTREQCDRLSRAERVERCGSLRPASSSSTPSCLHAPQQAPAGRRLLWQWV
ncbi:hypothetical protein B0T26DRAFT_673104 [Lasiosphaeria miniovina]|uniref:Uncharacterized protein n=1 Tax=Lasiosphaeria miniovina TaxID=1954250 RepID=A0AA40E563_9PEZI|nr:uncharacterized protein B0T26DRAFT_673104 [Lasiosphaeria miniovina]KAK0728599.1 hypothetical protein B0T26DRAFT_673104 [Lasiosphaeria miniovina]